MEAIKTRGIAKNGMLTVAVPQRFEEQELEVIVLRIADDENSEMFEQTKFDSTLNTSEDKSDAKS